MLYEVITNVEPVDLNQLLEYMAEGYNLTQTRMTIEGRCKKPYRGKPLALKRCIGNLIDNAIKYGQRVRVIVMDDILAEDKSEMLVLYFIDSGPGLPEEQLEKIFEPYYRLSLDTSGSGSYNFV